MKHQVPDALSGLPRPEHEEKTEVDDAIPQYGDHMLPAQYQHSVLAINRSQAQDRAKVTEPPPVREDSTAPDTGAVQDTGASTDRAAQLDHDFPPVREDPTYHPPLYEGETPGLSIPLTKGDIEDDAEDLLIDARAICAEDAHEAIIHDLESPDLPSAITTAEILAEQRTDAFCQSVLSNVDRYTNLRYFEDSQGILCHRHPRDDTHVQIVLPVSLHSRVLNLVHYSPLTGHPSQNRRHRRIDRTFYWPHMASNVANTVLECTH